MDVRHRKGKENVVADALSRSMETLEEEPEDGWYKKLFAGVKADPEKYLDFKVIDGVLYKFVATRSDLMDYHFEWKRCVPTSMRNDVIKQEHDNNLHVGYLK